MFYAQGEIICSFEDSVSVLVIDCFVDLEFIQVGASLALLITFTGLLDIPPCLEHVICHQFDLLGLFFFVTDHFGKCLFKELEFSQLTPHYFLILNLLLHKPYPLLIKRVEVERGMLLVPSELISERESESFFF